MDWKLVEDIVFNVFMLLATVATFVLTIVAIALPVPKRALVKARGRHSARR